MQAYLIVSFAPEYGGAEKVAQQQIEHLSNKGHKVAVYYLCKRGKTKAQPNVEVFFSKYAQEDIQRKKLFRDLIRAQELAALHDHLEQTWEMPVVGFDHYFQGFIRYFQHQKFYHWLHYTLDEDPKQSWFRRWQHKRKLTSLVARPRVITVAQAQRTVWSEWTGLAEESLTTIPNPIESKKIEKLSHQGSPRIPNQDYLIHIGRLVPSKRHDLLLKAYAQLKDRPPLFLLGEGPQKDSIEQQIQELNLDKDVTLLGYQKNPYPWIKNATGLILCSDHESWGLVLLESLALTTPVISSDCPTGPKEILEPYNPESLFETDNLNELTHKLQLLIDKKITVNPKNLEQYTIDKVLPQWEALYAQAVSP